MKNCSDEHWRAGLCNVYHLMSSISGHHRSRHLCFDVCGFLFFVFSPFMTKCVGWARGRGGVLNTSNLNVHQWEQDPKFVLFGLYIGRANWNLCTVFFIINGSWKRRPQLCYSFCVSMKFWSGRVFDIVRLYITWASHRLPVAFGETLFCTSVEGHMFWEIHLIIFFPNNLCLFPLTPNTRNDVLQRTCAEKCEVLW